METKKLIEQLERRGYYIAVSAIDYENFLMLCSAQDVIKVRIEIKAPRSMSLDDFKAGPTFRTALIRLMQDLQKKAAQMQSDTTEILRELLF